MPQNHFDQASRYLAKLDPLGFLHWLLEAGTARLPFRGWLDTRTIPFPGHPERVCDTVAELIDEAAFLYWALVIEFQTEPDAELFGRLLEYLGRLWRELRPTGYADQRFQVVAAVVNLTGSGATSREMTLPPRLRTLLQVQEINLAEQEAAPLLTAIAAGHHSRALLPWIPLLRGGTQPGIIEHWQEIAATEPDARRRGDYAGLAIVLADLVDARPVWKKALEGWNVKQSAQVLEWQEEARKAGREEGEQHGEQRGEQRGLLRGKQEAILHLLQGRFHKRISKALINKISNTTDLATLTHWFNAAITIGSLKEFQQMVES
jgi:hypothetical protein